MCENFIFCKVVVGCGGVQSIEVPPPKAIYGTQSYQTSTLDCTSVNKEYKMKVINKIEAALDKFFNDKYVLLVLGAYIGMQVAFLLQQQ